MALAVDALVTAHDVHREHPVGANEPGQRLAVGGEGEGWLR